MKTHYITEFGEYPLCWSDVWRNVAVMTTVFKDKVTCPSCNRMIAGKNS